MTVYLDIIDSKLIEKLPKNNRLSRSNDRRMVILSNNTIGALL